MTVNREVGGGNKGGKKGKGKQRHMNRGLMGTDNREGLTVGVGGWGRGEQWGKRRDNYN